MKRKNRKHWLKGMVCMLVMAMAMSMAVPTPAEAAGKVTVKVTSPKKGVKLSGTKLKMHVKKVQLQVKQGGKTVTAKASYKSSKPTVVTVDKKGCLVAKKNGTATVTVKYNGTVKKVKVTVAGHNWKAHTKTKKVKKLVAYCNCGVKLPECEKKYCAYCAQYPKLAEKGLCCCKQEAHLDKHTLNDEPNNYYKRYEYVKVKYTDYYYCDCGMKKAGEAEPK